MDNPKLKDEQKALRAHNTYLLALDGDVDFQPGMKYFFFH